MAYKFRRTVLRAFNAHDEKVIKYFDPCSDLLENSYAYEVVISYMFSKLEQAHREALIFGAVKIHGVDTALARSVIDKYDLTRKDFREKFKNIYGYRVPADAVTKITRAEQIRDKILHGKNVKIGQQQQCILDTIDYFAALNDVMYQNSTIWLAGDRRGYKGRKSVHNKATSRWILKGMGLLN